MFFDTLCVAVLAAATTFVVAACLCRQTMHAIAIGVVAFLASFALAAAVSSGRPASHQPTAEPDRPVAEPSDGFVTSQTCRTCHPQQYQSWYQSYHRTMTQVAHPDTVMGDFDGAVASFHGKMFRLSRDEDQLWVEGENVAALHMGSMQKDRRQLVMTTGSHHLQIYWYPTGNSRLIGMMPLAFIKAEQRWVPVQSSFLIPPADQIIEDEPGRWNHTCIECHATHGQLRMQSLSPAGPLVAETRAAELGIACEACHGPGEQHVRANSDPTRRFRFHLSSDDGDSIVDPKELSGRRASQVCGQCHGTTLAEITPKINAHGAKFRPGDELSDSRLIVRSNEAAPELLQAALAVYPQFLDERFWPDGMTKITGREYNALVESPCFKGGTFSCLSCHEMHKSTDDPRPFAEWANDQLKLDMDGNNACVQCHDEFASEAVLTQHTHHSANSSGSSCYNCHMPHTTYGLLTAIRSHQIDSPDVSVSLSTGRPSACNQCHLDRSLSWAADHLHDWYGVEKPSFTEDERKTAASILWLLRGDAAQRALMAWSYGWNSAHEASGTDWLAPYLAQLLQDPYDAVRLMAYRSLRKLPDFQGLEYDFIGPHEQRLRAHQEVIDTWNGRQINNHSTYGAHVLINQRGMLQRDVFERLLSERDDRPVRLAE